MKTLLLSVFTLLLFANTMQAQVVADAGIYNQNICPYDTALLGGSPTASGGTGPYTYEWSPAGGLSDSTVANPLAKPAVTTIYQLIVTDNLGAKDTSNVEVNPVAGPGVDITSSDTFLCSPGLVNFTTNTSNTAPPIFYLWDFRDGSQSTVANPSHTFVQPGGYNVSVQVTDASNCTATAFTYVSVSNLVVSVMPNNATCFGANNGVIQLFVNGGSAPYNYFWSNGAVGQVVNNLNAGMYSVTVLESGGCSASATAIITEPTPISLLVTTTDETTTGACDGTATAIVTGGSAPYLYTWSPLGTTTQTITNLCGGAYAITVVDVNSCTATGVGVVSASCSNNTLAVSVTSQDLTCAAPFTNIAPNVSGGTLPYSFTWSTGQTSPSVVVGQPGVYTLWVTDSTGCTKSVNDTVTSTAVQITLLENIPVSCNGINDGKIKIGITGGTPPYTIQWNNGSTDDSLINVGSGVYTVAVSDATSCTDTFTVYLNQNNTNWSYYIYLNATNANCASNGQATVSVYGGTAPFTFLWSNSDTSQIVTALAPGTYYTVTVSGADGCIRTGSAYISTDCFNIVEGDLFNDTNGNCVKDLGETTINNLSVVASGSNGQYYGYTDNNGHFAIHVPATGNFTVNVSPFNWSSNCSTVNFCGAQTASFNNLGDTVTLNFGLGASSGFDLALHPGWSTANPGFTKDYWVLYHQQSMPLYNGSATIVFKYDPILVYQSNNNGGVHNASAKTITWTVNNVPYPSWDWNTVPRAYFTVPASTPIGYQLAQEFWITPTSGDCDTADNHLLSIQPVTGSMDPNEKQVSPAGDIYEEDSVLTYTIHFQNTGNDTTYFITLKDTLSPHLNPASVVNLASSHDYTSFSVSGNGILTWLFNPIFLVDSTTNEAASKGFVTFSVHKKAGLPLNTQISNTAHIYFDYNEAVVTNTVTSKLSEPQSISHITGPAITVTAAPNPFTRSTQLTVEGVTGAYTFRMIDISGKLLKQVDGITSPRFEVDRQNLSAGVYFYSITTTTKQKAFGKLVVE